MNSMYLEHINILPGTQYSFSKYYLLLQTFRVSLRFLFSDSMIYQLCETFSRKHGFSSEKYDYRQWEGLKNIWKINGIIEVFQMAENYNRGI